MVVSGLSTRRIFSPGWCRVGGRRPRGAGDDEARWTGSFVNLARRSAGVASARFISTSGEIWTGRGFTPHLVTMSTTALEAVRSCGGLGAIITRRLWRCTPRPTPTPQGTPAASPEVTSRSSYCTTRMASRRFRNSRIWPWVGVPVCEDLTIRFALPWYWGQVGCNDLLKEAGLMEIETAPSENLSHEDESVN